MDKSTSTDDLINSTNVKEEIHEVGSSRKRSLLNILIKTQLFVLE